MKIWSRLGWAHIACKKLGVCLSSTLMRELSAQKKSIFLVRFTRPEAIRY